MSASDGKFYRPRITKRVDFASDLSMIRINPGGEFQFAPGQYATLGVEGSQKRSERPEAGSTDWSQPLVGVRVSRRDTGVFATGSVAEVGAYGQPPLGR